MKKLIARKLKKTESNRRQAGYHIAVYAYMAQGRWTFFQVLLFLRSQYNKALLSDKFSAALQICRRLRSLHVHRQACSHPTCSRVSAAIIK